MININVRNILKLLVIVFSTTGVLGLIGSSYNSELRIEEKAIFLLINSLNDSSIYESKNILLPLDFEEDMVFFKEGNYFSNGKLCMISVPEDIFDDMVIGYYRNNLELFLKYRDSLKISSYTATSIVLPSRFKRITYEKFKGLNSNKSYFFTVRHHLKAGDISVVEIHLVPYSKARNPFEYTFHVYFNGDEMTHWNISMHYDFEYDIDC